METAFFFDKEQLYNALTQSTEDYIFVCDLKTNITKLPQNLIDDFNLPGDYISNFYDIWLSRIHPDDQVQYIKSMENMINDTTDFHNLEYRIMDKHGEWVWIKCRGRMMRDSDKSPLMFAGIIKNISKRNKVDSITGLLNKYEFENQINFLLYERKPITVVIVNMDNFRNINELYDREFGDSVLRITGQYIHNVLPSEAIIYRLDSDEFGIIFSGTSEEHIEKIFRDINDHFNSQQEYKSKRYHCTLSIGGYHCDFDAIEDYQSLLKKANKALDYSKTHGKNKLTFYVSKISKDKTRELEIIEFLHESVENNFQNFEVYCQPQVIAHNGKLKGAEALLRWKCEKYGSISPIEFIPLLERTNLIIPVGRWVFEQAVKSCREWVKYNEDFKMSINISYLQLLDNDFVGFMKCIIEREMIKFSNIIVELTESRFVSDKELLKHTFSSIRELGMKIAMDDFGTGYSSLEILKEVPADIVKIDKAFVKNIKNSTFDMTFIKFIVELCHDVGIKVCLEGVEKIDEMDIVSTMNLDFIQGYLFGRPQDTNSFLNNYLIC